MLKWRDCPCCHAFKFWQVIASRGTFHYIFFIDHSNEEETPSASVVLSTISQACGVYVGKITLMVPVTHVYPSISLIVPGGDQNKKVVPDQDALPSRVRLTHVCISERNHHSSDICLSPICCQVIIWTNFGRSFIGHLVTYVSEIWNIT